MEQHSEIWAGNWDRRQWLAGLSAGTLALLLGNPAHAQLLGAGLNELLGKASDSALDKLAIPGAFYADREVRVAVPLLGNGTSEAIGKLFNRGRAAGLTDGLTRKLNDAAGLAAKEAKPIFRVAISRLSFQDVPGIVGQSDGASQYLRTSAAPELTGKLRPLVDSALGQVGAFKLLDELTRTVRIGSLAGLSRDRLGRSVTDQALNGIFKYIGGEEGKLRANPLKPAGSLLKGILGN
jgi:hypothetical protein